MPTVNRSLVYLVYSLLTLGAFAVAGRWSNDVTVGIATNLAAGLVIIVVIDTLLRLAEEHRLRPMKIAAHRTNMVARARLKSVFRVAHAVAQKMGTLPVDLASLDESVEIDARLANCLAPIPTQQATAAGVPLLKQLNQEVLSTLEYVSLALDRYGPFQDPEVAALFARLTSSTLFQAAEQLVWAPTPVNTTFPSDFWREVIVIHNDLARYNERTSNRFGLPLATP